jgi:hypothetical protein
MAFELACQTNITPSMQLHHAATATIATLYLVYPTFDPLVRAALAVEVASALLALANLIAASKSAPAAIVFALKLAFAVAFFYTRFFVGGIDVIDPAFVWSATAGMPPAAVRLGFACIICIHCCAVYWAGLVIVSMAKAASSQVSRLAPLAPLPMHAIAFWRGPRLLVAVTGVLALATLGFHRGRAAEAWASLRMCAWVALPAALAVARPHSGMLLLPLHLGVVLSCSHVLIAAAAIRLAHSKRLVHLATPLGLGTLLAGLSAVYSLISPPKQPLVYTSILGVMYSALLELRRQHSLLALAPMLMHVCGAALVFQACK